MHRLVTLAAVAAIALTACSDSGTTSNQTAPNVTITPSSTSTTTSAPRTPETASSPTEADTVATTATTALSAPGIVTQDDLVRFVAATESVLMGTPNQGIVYDSPEIYIAIAQAACARLSEGKTFDQVSSDLLTQLASTHPDDDNRLVGAILGAATHTICPEHAA
ncbi:MAG: DUF732 domain-containing protein [Ilumatobacteraceae bacterium]